jgi:hypothetical protein
MSSRRIPADQAVLHPGTVVYWHDDPHWEGRIDKFVSPDRKWVAVSYFWAEGGDNRAHVSNYSVDAPAPPRAQPRWASELQRSAEAQLRLPPMRRFEHQRLAGAILLWILVAAVTQNMVVVIALTCLFCALPIARRRI